MASWTIFLAAQLLFVPSCGGIVLESDNNLRRFRHEPALFLTDWANPRLLNGKLIVSGAASDATLHSGKNSTAERRWADALYPFEWERDWLGGTASVECRRWWWVSYAASSSYLVGLWAGTSYMRDRKPYDLKVPLAIWNLLLTVFSFVGMLRTVPHLLMLLGEFGFDYTLCRAARGSYGHGPPGLWVFLFIMSKYFELLDTAFLIARKRKVGFLHWYHHCSVLLYCWHAFVWEMPTGIYFVTMNYSVHAIMYFYYFLAAVCKRPPKWGLLVTILQLTQMALGIAVTLSHVRMLLSGSVSECDGHIPNLAAALGMYASYFVLFAQFLCSRWCVKRDDSSAAKLKKVD